MEAKHSGPSGRLDVARSFTSLSLERGACGRSSALVGKQRDEFASQESEFFKASIAAEDAGIAREQAREESSRLARQLFAGVVAACVLALIAFGMGGVAWFEMNKADAKAKVASERRKFVRGTRERTRKKPGRPPNTKPRSRLRGNLRAFHVRKEQAVGPFVASGC